MKQLTQRIKPAITATFLVFAVLLSGASLADEIETERLARLASEVELLRSLTEKIEQESVAAADDRLRFRYDLVVQQLSDLERGIRQHLKLVHAQPRNHFQIGDELDAHVAEQLGLAQ